MTTKEPRRSDAELEERSPLVSPGDLEQHVVEQGDDRGRAVFQVAEPNPDVGHDDQDGRRQGDQGVPLGVAGHLVAESHLENGVIVAEIMLYLLVAIACLRCMAIFNEHSVAHDPALVSDAVRNELILRRELYNSCNRATIFLTMLIFVSLPLLYLYVPTL